MGPSQEAKVALVLGGGGMFGAYQAGLWCSLSGRFQPDVIVGGSVGALNGWAIAGGCDPEDWAREWLSLTVARDPRWHWPSKLTGGMVDRRLFESYVQNVHLRFQPKTEFATVLLPLGNLRPFVVKTPGVEWVHLAAACAVPPILPLYRIGGRWCGDGAIPAVTPVWAALELGAQKIVAVHVMPRNAPWYIRAARRLVRGVSRWAPRPHARESIVWIEPAEPLGTFRDMIYWRRENAERMIEAGRREGRTAWPAIERLLQSGEAWNEESETF